MLSKIFGSSDEFQTPLHICEYMAGFLPISAGRILEPTPGCGNLVSVLNGHGDVTAPVDFFEIDGRFDWVVMNPPFTPMKLGYEILFKCMEMSDHIIALMPWLTMINSESRTKRIMEYGVRSITHLPRNVFKGSRVQTCILEMDRGWNSGTSFLVYDTF